jgi:hypothetical protein
MYESPDEQKSFVAQYRLLKGNNPVNLQSSPRVLDHSIDERNFIETTLANNLICKNSSDCGETLLLSHES